MKHEIIYTEYYALIVSDEEISYENYAIHLADKWILEVGAIHQSNGHKTIMDKEYGYHGIRREILAKYCKKIIAHKPLTDAPIFEGVPLLPEFKQEDDADKLAKESYSEEGWSEPWRQMQRDSQVTFKVGYNKAKETYKYTEDDLIAFSNFVTTNLMHHSDSNGFYIGVRKVLELFKNIQQPELPKYFECQMSPMNLDEIRENGKGFLHTNTNKMVVITNSKDQIELVGKYTF